MVASLLSAVHMISWAMAGHMVWKSGSGRFEPRALACEELFFPYILLIQAEYCHCFLQRDGLMSVLELTRVIFHAFFVVCRFF